MRGLWAVLVSMYLGTALMSAPDLDSLEPITSVGTGPVEVEPLTPLAPLEGKKSGTDGFMGVSIPSNADGNREDVPLMPLSPLSPVENPGQIDVGMKKGVDQRTKPSPTRSLEAENSGFPLEDDVENTPLFPEGTPEERADGRLDNPLGHLAFLGILATLFGGVFLWLWYRNQIKGKIKPNARLPMQVLGQTWLDGQAKIMTLRVGSKILIIAKSAQYCTTLDVISDPDEVNLITLGGGQVEEDFQKVLKASQPKQPQDIPDAEGIQSDLRELKRQLGTLKGKS